MSSTPKTMRRPPEGYYNSRFGQPGYKDRMDECMS